LKAGALVEELRALAIHARLSLEDEEAGQPAPAAPVDDPFHLTSRERQVLALVCEGCSNQQIAARLYVTKKTAEVHVSNILHKLEVTSRGQAAAKARDLGLLDGGGSG
jgi:DNA-binding NarL/FixJ family response regulator